MQQSRAQGGGIKESSDQLAEGIEYEGKVLPQMEGAYRRRMAGDFGLVVYGDVKTGSKMEGGKMKAFTDFRIQVRCSEERHAKMAPIVADRVPDYLPDNFAELFKYLRAGAAE